MDRALGQFEAVTETATGTSGAKAWTAREPNGGRDVLIKRLPLDMGRTRATQALALRHPHIVPTRRWFRDAEFLYIVRDYVPGTNLRQTLADASRRAFDRLLVLLRPVLDALEHAHQFGMAHGGVTPENVLVDAQGVAWLSDFAAIDARSPSRARYVPPSLLNPDGLATPRADFYAFCELCKEFLPERAHDDEAGQAARTRLLRNLSEVQQSASSTDELRYKLDAIAKMADLLGFASGGLPLAGERQGARLVCAVAPPTATLNPGGGTSVTLNIRNTGDTPLHIEAVGANVVWANPYERFTPFDLRPDESKGLIFALSGARLSPGAYSAGLIIRSNSGMTTLMPTRGLPWHEQAIGLPVVVNGVIEPPPAPSPIPPELGKRGSDASQGIAVTQEPDPALVRYGQIGVVHIGVRNIGTQRIRLDKISTWPPWLAYPGDFQAVWIEPDSMQFLGFSVLSQTLGGGDYKAEITFITSTTTETTLGPQPVWREMKCAVRVRVVRGVGDLKPGAKGLSGLGCAPLLLAGLTGIVWAILR